MIKIENFHQAEVISNKDPLEEGRVQIYIASFMQGWKLAVLPWARPWSNATGGDFGNTTSAMNCVAPTAQANSGTPTKQFTFGELDVPEEKSVVWVFFTEEEGKKNAFYLTGVQLSKSSPSKSFQKTVGSFLTSDIKGKYPDLKFRIDKNGYVKFHSSNIDVRESGEYNSSDSYFYHKDDQTTTNAHSQVSRIVAGDTKFELKGDQSTKIYSAEISTDTNSKIKLKTDKTQNSGEIDAFVDNLVKLKLLSSSTAKSADLNVGTSKISIDDIAGQITLLTSQLIQLTAATTTITSAQTNISGILTVGSPIQAPSLGTPPLSPPAPLTLKGSLFPGPAIDPAVKGFEYSSTLSDVCSSLNDIIASLGSIATAISALYTAFIIFNPTQIAASASALGSAASSASSAATSASSANNSINNALSLNVLIN